VTLNLGSFSINKILDLLIMAYQKVIWGSFDRIIPVLGNLPQNCTYAIVAAIFMKY